MRKILAGAGLLGAGLLAVAEGGTATSVEWKSLGNQYKDGKASMVQTFTVSGDLNFDRLGFNMFLAPEMEVLNPTDTLVEVMPGYYYIKSPRLASQADSIQIPILVHAGIIISSLAPDGVHRIESDGTTHAVNYIRQPLSEPGQWQIGPFDRMPYGAEIYDENARRATESRPGVYDVIPSFKKVTPLGGESQVKEIVYEDIYPENPEYYRMKLRNGVLTVACRPDKRLIVMNHFNSKVLDPAKGMPLPDVEIENWPDFRWRGQHIDIARNFQTPATMNRILELMSANMINRLHFHVTDDEAWRLEIDGLPELTSIGSRRGFSDHGEDLYLYQLYAGDGNPDSSEGTANGFWTREEFKDFIRKAYDLGIEVLPEIESPGHARAAIKAMEARHRAGDSTYRLIHDGDTSVYTSAQAYHDDVMNPALEGPYRFMEKVFDEIIRLYEEAEVPLPGIHIGGDEVAYGAWSGSSEAQELMKREGLETQSELHALFVRRMARMLAQRGVKMFGWEEIAVGHGDDFNAEVAQTVGGVNCWHSTPDAAIAAVKSGFPVILSNVNRLYFDLVYSGHPEERGLNWGGEVDEFDAFGAYVSELCPLSPDSIASSVIGLQAQAWSETVRSPQDLYRMLYPKTFGLAERGWNSAPSYTEAQFNAIIGEKEIPALVAKYQMMPHLHQPGIKIEDGKVLMNTPYCGGEIRYTTDGTDPTEVSALYTAPFPLPDDPSLLRARYFYHGLSSLTTYPDPR